MVRFAAVGELALTPARELRRLDGRQRAALNRTLPIGRDDIAALPRDVLDLDALDGIRVVDGGHGNSCFGANMNGEALAIPLFGSDVRRVDVYGRLPRATVVVRAIAVGARVVVRHRPPDTWAPLVTNVNDPRTLYMSRHRSSSGTTVAHYSLCILDAREATEDPTVGTQLRVHRTAGTPEDSTRPRMSPSTRTTRIRLGPTSWTRTEDLRGRTRRTPGGGFADRRRSPGPPARSTHRPPSRRTDGVARRLGSPPSSTPPSLRRLSHRSRSAAAALSRTRVRAARIPLAHDCAVPPRRRPHPCPS